MKCDFCGAEEALPFVCNYCGGAYCAEHRLPEVHQCKGDLTQRRMIIPPPQTTTFTWSDSQPQQPPPMQKTSTVFSGVEVRDIVISWLGIGLAIAIALSGGVFGGALGNNGGLNLLVLAGVALITVGPGFIFHELSHKFVARRYGFWAEFRMWPSMLALAIFVSLTGFFFAAPGATYISGSNINLKENGHISLAGPLTNVAIAGLFVPVFFFGGSPWGSIAGFGMWINMELAVFNMLPIGPLDGAKVLRWNKVVWVAAMAVFAVLTYLAFKAFY